MILLDTDILIDFFRGFPPSLTWFQGLNAVEIAVPGFVALELYAGCVTKREQTQIHRKLSPFALLWPSAQAATDIIPIFATAHLSHSLGLLDSLIAATAITHNLSLHTFNQKHFAGVPGLKTVQPYTR